MLPDGTIVAAELWKAFRPDPPRRLGARLQLLGQRLRGHKPARHWVLRDINLSIQPGESVGLVGDNGSGKTTLLKTMNRVMYPTVGSMAVGGRVGALIEVRAGLHPELTGRENILLTGVLLGLKRSQVVERFDEIVEFSELEDAIDRQLKFYSSGMQMRLGFSLAAFLEPDILLIDEALAVGDIEFQQRCLDRIRSVLAQGTTVVFVSHDLDSVESVCERTIWLQDGIIRADGPSAESLAMYRSAIESDVAAKRTHGPVRVTKVETDSGNGEDIVAGGPLHIRFVVDTERASDTRITLGLSDGAPKPFLTLSGGVHLGAGQTELSCHVPSLPVAGGRYFLWMNADSDDEPAGEWHPITAFDVTGPAPPPLPRAVVRIAPVVCESRWEVSS